MNEEETMYGGTRYFVFSGLPKKEHAVAVDAILKTQGSSKCRYLLRWEEREHPSKNTPCFLENQKGGGKQHAADLRLFEETETPHMEAFWVILNGERRNQSACASEREKERLF